jgi:hypothetical protein
MTKEKMMFEAACDFYGSCIGSKFCAEMVVEILMEEFTVTKEKAEEVAATAYKEWMDAYT